MSDYAKLRQDLVSAKTEVDGAVVYNIKDPITGTYFRLREPDFWLINQLDGKTPYDEIADRFKNKFDLIITADNVLQFVDALDKLYFLEGSRAEQATSRKSFLSGKGESLFSRMLFVKIKAFDPGRVLEFLTRLYRPFHNGYGFAGAMLVLGLGAAVLFANTRYFAVNLVEIFNVGSIAMIIVGIAIILSTHEFAHAVSCRYYGGEVKEIGFLLLYFQPCVYADLSDAWLFEKKRHRLAVVWAGPFFQFLLLAMTVLVWRVTVPGSTVNELARIMTIVSFVSVIFNFNPLIKLDGYYLLSDFVDIPNLRAKSFAYMGYIIKRRILGWPVETIRVTPRERRIFLTYAAFAFVYSALLLGWVFVIVAGFLVAEMGGLGLLLLFAVLFLSLKTKVVSFGKGVVTHLTHMGKIFKNPLRASVNIIILVVVIVLLFVMPYPRRVSGEITLRPMAECTIRLNKQGLLETEFRRGGKDTERKSSYLKMTSSNVASLELMPLVRDGQRVDKGDTVAVLLSNQVATDLRVGHSSLEALRQELALLKAPPKPDEIAEAEAQVLVAQTTYDQLLRDLDRTRGLARKNLITSEELESAQSAVDIAAAELANKRARLQLVKAPPKPEEVWVIEAQIESQEARIDLLRTQQAGQNICAPESGRIDFGRRDDKVLSIISDGKMEILVPVSDFDIGIVEVGQAVRIKVRSYPSDIFDGEVVHVPVSARQTEDGSRFEVVVLLDNAEELLRDGMTGYAKIETGSASLARLIARKVSKTLRVEFWSWW